MAVNRRILQQALANAGKIQQQAASGKGFDPRGGYGVLAAQLGTAAIGAFAQKRANDKLMEIEKQEQMAFGKALPQFAGLASQLSPETRQALILKQASSQIDSQFARPEAQSPLGKLQADIKAGLLPENIGMQAIQKQIAPERKTIETDRGFALLDERTGKVEPLNVKTPKQAEKEKEKKENLAFDVAALSSVKDKVATVNNKIDQLLNNPDLDFAIGKSGLVARNVSGTKSFGIAQDVKTITANAAFQALQSMREASKTGGALGQVSERELDLLENSFAAIDPALPDKQFKRNLKEVKKEFNKILKRGEKRFVNLYGKSQLEKLKEAPSVGDQQDIIDFNDL